jgi:EAL domain-containing protein (putative c-di-GMP-specific phosphodiesterase class I)
MGISVPMSEPAATSVEGAHPGLGGLGALVREFRDPLAALRRIVEESTRLIKPAQGASVELVDGEALRCVSGVGILRDLVGHRLPMNGSLAGRAVQCGSTLRSDDAGNDVRVDRVAAARLGIVSVLCVPLRYTDRLVGALTVASSSPSAFSDRDVATLGGLSSFMTAAVTAAIHLSSATAELISASHDTEGDRDLAAISDFISNVLRPGALADLEAADRVEHVLRTELLDVVYQPIVDLVTGRVVAAEALARFAPEPYRPPQVWFAEAWQAGFGPDLELLAIEKAVERVERLRDGVRLALNLSPQAILHPRVAPLLTSLSGERFTIELTEHVAIDDYPGVRRALAGLCKAGVQIAVDDTGAGFASLAHIIQLAPDIIKLDGQLIRGIDGDPVRRSLATAIVRFAADIGAGVVAESVETAQELDAVRALGIGYGQGLLLGAPGPVEVLPSTVDLNVLAEQPAVPRRRAPKPYKQGRAAS